MLLAFGGGPRAYLCVLRDEMRRGQRELRAEFIMPWGGNTQKMRTSDLAE